jgi:uncharacterized protein (TIGR03437 family)
MRPALPLLLAFLAFAPAPCGAQRYAVHRSGPKVAGSDTVLDIFGPGVLAVDDRGNEYVAVRDGIIRVDPSGTRTRIAGAAGDPGFNPRAVALDPAGNLFLADTANGRVVRRDAATGRIATLVDGLDAPSGVALDGAGNLFIAVGTRSGDDRFLRRDAATGMIAAIAPNARFRSLGGIAADVSGNLYIADTYNNRICRIDAATGKVTAVDSDVDYPLGLATDASGNLYIADSGNFRIRKLTAATGVVITLTGSGPDVYLDAQHGYPCSVAVDASGNLYVADSGASRVRKLSAEAASRPASEAEIAALPHLRSRATTSGFKINVTYDSSVPAAAQTAFNSLVSVYEALFTTNDTMNLNVMFGITGLGESETEELFLSYSQWRAALMANAAANPSNTYAVAAAASLPPTDPLGQGNILIDTTAARELGFSVNTSLDATIILSTAANFEYTGVATSSTVDFMDVAAHELDETLEIGSALTGLADNAPLPTDDYFTEDYFRYSAPGTRAVTTSPTAVVYFSYDGGKTNVAQFNQAYSAMGDTDLDRNDWIYGNFGCPAATPHIQDAISCGGQAEPVGQPGSPEAIVLNALGYNSGASLSPQTISFVTSSGSVAYGSGPISLNATASSGLPVTFTSNSLSVCTVFGNVASLVGIGSCSITASQSGNSVFAPVSVTQTFTVFQAAQQISFPRPSNVAFGAAPIALNATASSGLPVGYSSSTTSVCTISGSLATISNAGLCIIAASQPGNADFLAALSVTESFTVIAATQSISFPAPANVGLGSAPFFLAATASSGLPVAFTSSTLSVCTVSGTLATTEALGTCTITATQPGNANYLSAASVTQSFIVGKAQTISVVPPASVVLGAPSFTLIASASSGLAISFTAAPAAVCSVAGSTVSILGAGVCSITATQAGNSTYAAASPVTVTFTANAGPNAPSINSGGVVPIYSGVSTIQPGSWISIFGANLAPAVTLWSNNFPTALGGTTVKIDNKLAYLWYVSPTQINLQAPDDSATGPVAVTVTNSSGSWTSLVSLAPQSPSFSLLDGKHVAGIVLVSNGLGSNGSYSILGPTGSSLGYPTVAARAGDTVELFGVGFGPTTPPVPSGQPYSGAAPATNPVQLMIGGTAVSPIFAGLSSAGLYQINLTIPAGLGTGDVKLTATVAGVQTQSGVVISLQ